MIGQQIIEVLNKDEKAIALLNKFNEAAKKAGMTGEEYDKAREVVLMMAMYQNKEAMALAAAEAYAELTR